MNDSVPAATATSASPARMVVDARGSWCPGPLMELVRVIKDEPVGTEFELLSSDEGSRRDIPMWLEKAHHQLIEVQADTGFDRFIVRKTHE